MRSSWTNQRTLHSVTCVLIADQEMAQTVMMQSQAKEHLDSQKLKEIRISLP